MGVSENSLFAVFHPDAMDLFNVCSSLEKVRCGCTSGTWPGAGGVENECGTYVCIYAVSGEI